MTKPTDRVQAALDALGLSIRIIEFPETTATAEQAAAAVGCAQGAIVKSLLFLVDGRPAVVLVSGDRMVDQRKLAAHFGLGKKKIRLAESAAVLKITDYEVGGVPPVGHVANLPTLIDESLGRFDIVWAAAGTRNTVFPIAFSKLVEITAGEVIAV